MHSALIAATEEDKEKFRFLQHILWMIPILQMNFINM